ncbi:phage tail spike protein [Polycladomyces zharkentensis]|nr:phage tail spike protein [Polycladomyces sp. WAk]
MAKIPNLYILDRFEKAIGILNPSLPNACPFFDDVRTERIEYAYLTYEFSVPGDHPAAQNLVVGNLIVYPYRTGTYNLFRIVNTEEDHSDERYIKRITCENAAVGDLISNIILPTKLSSYTLSQAISYLLQGTNWQAGEVELAGTQDIVFDDVATSLDALHQVMDKFGAEIEFVVEFNGLTITRRLVHARLQRGRQLNKPFVYGLNLKGAKRKEDYTQLVTALYGIGPKDSAGNLLTFDTYNPTLSYPYEKPVGAKWVGDQDALQRWSKDGKHIFGIYKDDKATNAVELFNNTLTELKRRNRPQLTYEVDIALLPDNDIRLYDTILVKDTTFEPELVLEARIVEVKESLTDPSKNQVSLGDYQPIQITPNDTIKEIQKQLRDTLDTAKKAAGTGTHVIANTPKPLANGDYANFNHSLTIQVTENVHLGYVSVFCDTAGQSGTVELRDGNGNTIEKRQFSNLVAGENRLKLDFLLRQEVGTYQLYGDFSGNTYRTTSGVSFPYDSGSFKITGTSSPSGYWYHFYDISIGGPGVKGAYGQELRLGDSGSRYGKVVAYDSNGETIAIIDDTQVTFGSVVAENVQAPNVVTTGIPAGTTVTYYVNANTGSDDNDGSSSTPLASVYAAIDRLPRVFDGTVKIYLQSDIYEDIILSGFMGSGKIFIVMNGYTMTGTFLCKSVKMRVELYGGTESSTNLYGRINAKAGENIGVIQIFETDYFYANYLKVYGNSGSGGCTGVVTTYDNSFAYYYKCEFYNAVSACVYSAYGATTMLNSCVGSGATYGVMADYAGYIGWSTQIPDGAGNPIRAVNGGMVNPSSVGQGQSGSGTGGSTPTAPSVYTWDSTCGDSWRTVYNSWRGDGTVRQGDWQGYGLHTGIWLFSSGLSSTVTGKTIKRIRVYLKRLRGGNDKVTVTLRMHSYTSKPTGQPSVLSPTYNVTFAVGEAKWIDLPSSWFSYFSNGTAKGIGLYTTNDSDAYYAVFDDSAKLEITYV